MVRLALFALCVSACGDPLLDDVYQGEPRSERFCVLQGWEGLDTRSLTPRFFWIVDDAGLELVFDDEVRFSEPLEKLRVRMYEEPPAEVRRDVNGAEVAFGQLALFAGDTLVGIDSNVVVFASAPTDTFAFGPLAPGYQLMVEDNCNGELNPRFRDIGAPDFCYLEPLAEHRNVFQPTCPTTRR